MRWASFWKLTTGVFCCASLSFTSGTISSSQTASRHLPPVPIGQAPDPFGEQDAVLAKAVGDGEGAAVGLAVLVFGQDAEGAGADPVEGCGMERMDLPIADSQLPI